MTETLLPVEIGVTPVDGNLPYSSTRSIAIAPILIPPGVQITLSLPPFFIQINEAECLELAFLLIELFGAAQAGHDMETFDYSRSPQQILEDHATPGSDITYTNTTAARLLIQGILMALNGAPGEQGQIWVNGSLVYYMTIPAGEAFASVSLNALVILEPLDVLKMTNTSALGTLGFVVSGVAVNTNA